MKIIFIVNNKDNRLAKLLPKLDQYSRKVFQGEVQFLFTERKKHAIELARQATENECDYLIAVGGDGTLHEVINGVMRSEIPSTEYPTIGLLPYGSANDFARTAGICKSTEELFELIQSNSTQKIDLGKLELQETRETRYFINIVGVGLGPEVVRNMEQSSGVLGPGFQYFWHIIKGFLRYRKKQLSCSSDSWQWQGKLLQMAIANGRFFGRAICIAPDAQLADGKLQVAIFGNLSIWDYLKNLGKLKKGIKISHPQVFYQQTSEVLIESEEACGIEADGEYVGIAPATISVLPEALNFLKSSGKL
ncbi:diacylglycerol/lipid kinase family protein [Lentiprolixibacter aurantiacus]|uniref:Diacylglycerol kinase family lipid kinase n=1 Tax=Lentiprolixibacter aurantiacus TaxID=2993939 RepID=A0AAE3MHX3_9FLAO|nr:diacylglycerol kinase family protein [Lentiprolixibacter aurantiacus]MCX2718105.1 diacylglycerol kinase family lipid kinase [Lentiprolixibacter aurantiacus]